MIFRFLFDLSIQVIFNLYKIFEQKYDFFSDVTSIYPLKPHMGTHNGVKPYAHIHTVIVKKLFPIIVYLTHHIRTYTIEKPYKCCQWGQDFSQNSILIIHLRKQTRDKPYKYSKCEQGFAHKSHLTGQLWTHAGKKTYQCIHCEKVSIWSS